MSNLTDRQLTELTDRINARFAEFGADMFAPLSPGMIRIAHDVIAEWQGETAPVVWPPAPHIESAPTPKPEPKPEPAPISASAVAALGPEHVVVTPLANGNGTHKGTESPIRDSNLPSKADLIREVKRIAMAGMMPTMAAFDAARPANWATAQAHLLRLDTNWTELAEEAGLQLRRGPSNTESNP